MTGVLHNQAKPKVSAQNAKKVCRKTICRNAVKPDLQRQRSHQKLELPPETLPTVKEGNLTGSSEGQLYLDLKKVVLPRKESGISSSVERRKRGGGAKLFWGKGLSFMRKEN